MQITGIIAEYNPFHNGHAYQLSQAREQTHADYIVVILNGNFMQRGVPAILNKYQRAAMAVAQGADAVFELPTLYGTASAEFFAYGGVRLLDDLNCISALCFGCEDTSLELLRQLADFLIEEPENYRCILNQALSDGLSFPKARQHALHATFQASDASSEQLDTLLTSPNAILGIEYLKALRQLQSSITPAICLRTDTGYHNTALTGRFCSATAIREALLSHGCTENLLHYLPASTYSILQSGCHMQSPISLDDFYPYLQYCLWNPARPLTEYLDINTELSNRIQTLYDPALSCSEFLDLLVNKSYTKTRILRSLLHILLDIRSEQMMLQRKSNSMHYARLLAFRQEATPLLKYINAHSSIPVINKVSTGLRQLKNTDSLGASLLEQDIASAHLYELAASRHYQRNPVNDFRAGIFIDSQS